jgi:hypothetical protein
MSFPTSSQPCERGVALNLALLTLLVLIAWAPLAYPGFLQTHSGFLPVYHAQEIAAGADPLAWTPRVGADFDPWRSDGRLPIWIAALAIKAGFAGTAAVRLTFAGALALGAWGMYAWARRLLSTEAALLAAVVYTFLPWTLASVYVRGALGEMWLWGITPWLLWGGMAGNANPWRARAVTALAAAALLWCQAGLALFVLTLAALSLAFTPASRAGNGLAAHEKEPFVLRLPSFVSLLAGTAVGLLGLIPWLRQPATELNPLFGEHFLYLFQLLLPNWGAGASQPGWQDALSFQMGGVALSLAFLALYGWLSVLRSPASVFRPSSSVLITLILLLLTLGFSAPLWRITGAQRLLTYPWQLLTVAASWLSLVAGSAMDAIPALSARPRWAAVIGLTILASYPYLAPTYTQVMPDARPLAILGENQIALVSAPVSGDIRPGGTLTVTLTWQALKPMALDYTVFIHLLDGQEGMVAQRDMQPQDNKHPTNTWSLGELVRDEHPLTLSATAAPGPYHINLGLYDYRTGQRLRIGEGNFVRLDPHAP